MSPSVTEADVFTALRSFLIAVLPAGTEVVQAQNNGVPMPLGPFVAMNSTSIRRLSTNVGVNVPGSVNPGSQTVSSSVQMSVQLDFFGVGSGDMAVTVQTLFRDGYGVSLFPPTVTPLYADDPVQLPLIGGEANFEQRWKLDAVMQFNPAFSPPLDFANALTVGVVSVDQRFPP